MIGTTIETTNPARRAANGKRREPLPAALEAALLTTDQGYRTLLEALDVAVYTTDAAGRITFFNEAAAELWGRRPELGKDEWCGTWRLYWLDGSPMAHDECPMAVTLRENRPVRGAEAIAERPDGSRIFFMPFPTPLRDHSGALVGAVNVLVDITERKRAQAEAEEAINQSIAIKDQFLSLVSHELKTPITVILGNADLLLRREETLPKEHRHQSLLDVVNESEKLQRIIENLLLVTRIEAGQQLELEPVRLPALILEAVAAFQRRNPSRPTSVGVEGEVPIVLGQSTALSLVLDNLLSNAHKYSPPGSSIEVRTRVDEDGRVEVYVRDYGIGLDEDEAEKVFTPFYRSSRAKSVANGIGVGLAVCRRVIDAHGGAIRAVVRPGGGCDFVFALQPLVNE